MTHPLRPEWVCDVCGAVFPVLVDDDGADIDRSDEVAEGYLAEHMAEEHGAVV